MYLRAVSSLSSKWKRGGMGVLPDCRRARDARTAQFLVRTAVRS